MLLSGLWSGCLEFSFDVGFSYNQVSFSCSFSSDAVVYSYLLLTFCSTRLFSLVQYFPVPIISSVGQLCVEDFGSLS